jgi:magnesium-transporting ATPase (P-type)
MVNKPESSAAWHALPVSGIAHQLDTNVQHGLSEAEAARRLARHGPNTLLEKPPESPWRMFAGQFTDFMILVLIAAAVISGVVGDLKDTLTIAVIVLLNALIGFAQEYRAERAMAAETDDRKLRAGGARRRPPDHPCGKTRARRPGAAGSRQSRACRSAANRGDADQAGRIAAYR